MRRPRSSASLRLDPWLIATLVIAAVAIAWKVRATFAIGPGWDAFAFLASAAQFAGRGYGYVEAHRPPLLPLLTAVLFRLGYYHETAIQVMDGLLAFSGVAAAYLLFRRAFPRVAATAGALAFLATTPMWLTLGRGLTDIGAVALCLWSLLALVKATEEDARWYIVALPLLLLSVLIRYTSLLFFFAAGMWVVFRWLPIRQARRLIEGSAASALLYAPAAVMYQQRFGDILFPFIIAFDTASDTTGGASTKAAENGPAFAWFARNVLTFVSGQRTSLLAIIVLGVALVGVYWAVRSFIAERHSKIGTFALAAMYLGFVGLSLAKGGMVARQVAIPVAVFGLWRSFGPREPGNFPNNRTLPVPALTASMLAWCAAFVDFHGHQPFHEIRYFIPMTPGLVFLVLLGWESAIAEIKRQLAAIRSSEQLRRAVAPVAWGTLLGLTLVTLFGQIVWLDRTPDVEWQAARDSARALGKAAAVRPGLVYSDFTPITAWYLQSDPREMPIFVQSKAFQHELDKSDARYYVTYHAPTYAGFSEIAHFGPATEPANVLERTSALRSRQKRVLLLGQAWDTYLEDVNNFSFSLSSFSGRYGWEGSAFLDWSDPRRLAKYDAVAIYKPRWRDRHRAEDNLRKYVERGGVAFVDMSANLGGAYAMTNTVILDTLAQRTVFSKQDRLAAAASFATRHPRLEHLGAPSFRDENGGSWVGTTYQPMSPRHDEVLVRLGAQPIVTVQRLGKGRVYWIGGNLVWHAFRFGNDSERELVRAVFAEGLRDSKIEVASGR